MKKRILIPLLALNILTASHQVLAKDVTHTVVSGDSMWKIAVRYQVGLDEIIAYNPQISDPQLIYPGDKIKIPSQNDADLSFENEVISLVNQIRKDNGLKPLTADWELSRVARFKSQDMRDKGYFSHNSPTYGTPFKMIRDFGLNFKTAGENIARGQRTPQAVVDAWMNSSGHRANILKSTYTKIGVGYISNGHYWTQMFIG